jgi:hypothetical protein
VLTCNDPEFKRQLYEKSTDFVVENLTLPQFPGHVENGVLKLGYQRQSGGTDGGTKRHFKK